MTDRRPRPDPRCGNCDGRGCMGCVFREYDHVCEDDCPSCCSGPYPEHVVHVWCDDTAPVGGMFRWRGRCLCMGRSGDPAWRPSWAAHTQTQMVALAQLHASDPREDDWINLNDRMRSTRIVDHFKERHLLRRIYGRREAS